MNETQMSYLISKKAEQMPFNKLTTNGLSIIAIVACSLLLMACSKTTVPETVVVEEESALSIPFTTGPTNPPEVNPPTTNPPINE